MKILMTNLFRFYDEQLEKIRDLGYELHIWESEEIEVTEEFLDVDIIIGNWLFEHNDISRFPKVKWVQLMCAGYDTLPLEEIKKRDIFLTNAKGVYSIPIAEWVILKILEIYKNTRYFEEGQRNKDWTKNHKLIELYGKTVGIIGTGSIASEIAIRAKAFGCNVIGLNTDGRTVEGFDKVIKKDDINTLLEESDIVVSTVPIDHSTRNMIDRSNLKYMKDNGVLINISRGGIINEEDLIEHLNQGKLLGVALDVFDVEPLPQDSPLWEHPKMLVTPHNSFNSDNIKNRIFNMVYENLKAFKEDKPLKNEVKF